MGEDANADLALLKIDAEELIPPEFGDSDELVVGDECFAIGNPLGVALSGHLLQRHHLRPQPQCARSTATP